MKLIFRFLFLLSIFSIQRSHAFRSGADRYFQMTINFADVPLAPATITLWTPPSGNWILDWGQDFTIDYFSLGTAQMGACNPSDTGDAAYVYTQHHDLGVFALGNGVLLDEMFHGPFWCDSDQMYFGNEGNVSMFDTNAYILPSGQGIIVPPFAAVISLGELRSQYNPDNNAFLWGFGADVLKLNGTSWDTPITMNPPSTFFPVVYNQSYPLKIQWGKSNAYTATFPNTGSWTFRVRGMKIN